MKMLLKLSRAIDAAIEGLGNLVSWLVILMVGIGFWNVATRYLGRWLGQLSSNALLEMQWYLFALVFLLGAAYALKHNEHVRVDIFYKGWSPRRRAWVNFLGSLLFLIPFCAIAIYFSWQWTLNSWHVLEVSPNPQGLPRYPIKSAIIVSLFLLILQGISEAIKNWAFLTGLAGTNPEGIFEEDGRDGG